LIAVDGWMGRNADIKDEVLVNSEYSAAGCVRAKHSGEGGSRASRLLVGSIRQTTWWTYDSKPLLQEISLMVKVGTKACDDAGKDRMETLNRGQGINISECYQVCLSGPTMLLLELYELARDEEAGFKPTGGGGKEEDAEDPKE
ncbi:hypothetical protein Tco_1048951, partial [Tanacetum coccineum]